MARPEALDLSATFVVVDPRQAMAVHLTSTVFAQENKTSLPDERD